MAEDKLTATLSLAHQISDEDQGVVNSLRDKFAGDMTMLGADGQGTTYAIQMTPTEFQGLNMKLMFSPGLRLSRG